MAKSVKTKSVNVKFPDYLEQTLAEWGSWMWGLGDLHSWHGDGKYRYVQNHNKNLKAARKKLNAAFLKYKRENK
jgi:hypothetical protein